MSHFRPAHWKKQTGSSLFQTCLRDNFATSTWVKTKHVVGEPTAEWVSYECSSNKHGLWILLPKHMLTWALLVPINTDEQNMWSSAVIHLVIYRIGHRTDLNLALRKCYTCGLVVLDITQWERWETSVAWCPPHNSPIQQFDCIKMLKAILWFDLPKVRGL